MNVRESECGLRDDSFLDLRLVADGAPSSRPPGRPAAAARVSADLEPRLAAIGCDHGRDPYSTPPSMDGGASGLSPEATAPDQFERPVPVPTHSGPRARVAPRREAALAASRAASRQLLVPPRRKCSGDPGQMFA